MSPADGREPSSITPELPYSGIHVDAEGDWHYEGKRIIREDIIDFFLENIRLDPGGKFIIEWNGQSAALDAEDTPFVVSRVDKTSSEKANGEEIRLMFRHWSRSEALAPDTLETGEANVLYCRIGEARFRARFSRPAYYQLAEWIDEDAGSGRFYIELNGTRYFIAESPGRA